jgi:hypothetical protein
MRLSHIHESERQTSFPIINRRLEERLSLIDVDEIVPEHGSLIDVPIEQIRVREKSVYQDTVDQYQAERDEFGVFQNPSGHPDDTWHPWGIKIGNFVVIMDGTHRAEVDKEHGLIKMHVFDKWW